MEDSRYEGLTHDQQIKLDMMLYGNAYEVQNEDGTKERIDPRKVRIHRRTMTKGHKPPENWKPLQEEPFGPGFGKLEEMIRFESVNLRPGDMLWIQTEYDPGAERLQELHNYIQERLPEVTPFILAPLSTICGIQVLRPDPGTVVVVYVGQGIATEEFHALHERIKRILPAGCYPVFMYPENRVNEMDRGELDRIILHLQEARDKLIRDEQERIRNETVG